MKQISGKSVYSVSEVNALARQTLENMSFWVEGEISSFKGLNHHYRYLYFNLKDPNTGYKLPCILEPSTYQSLDFEMEEGIMAAELEKLKKKLENLGYFDPSRKRPLPNYPTNIAIITSKIADAWYDF